MIPPQSQSIWKDQLFKNKETEDNAAHWWTINSYKLSRELTWTDNTFLSIYFKQWVCLWSLCGSGWGGSSVEDWPELIVHFSSFTSYSVCVYKISAAQLQEKTQKRTDLNWLYTSLHLPRNWTVKLQMNSIKTKFKKGLSKPTMAVSETEREDNSQW